MKAPSRDRRGLRLGWKECARSSDGKQLGAPGTTQTNITSGFRLNLATYDPSIGSSASLVGALQILNRHKTHATALHLYYSMTT